MTGLRIHPLCVGLFGGPVGEGDEPAAGSPASAYRSAMFMFVVTGGEHPIVVDTGTLDSEAARVRQNRILHRPPELEPAAALRRIGVDPGEVRTVVNTHLHWDHCANNELFPNAAVYVQRSEVAYALDPLDQHRSFYDKLPGVQPAWLQSWDRIVAVDGDLRLTEHVSLLWLPGHSPGSQGVLVRTDRGEFLIAGDTVNSERDWRGDESVRHIAPSLLTSLLDWTESVERIERLGCTVIPSHDLGLLEAEIF